MRSVHTLTHRQITVASEWPTYANAAPDIFCAYVPFSESRGRRKQMDGERRWKLG